MSLMPVPTPTTATTSDARAARTVTDTLLPTRNLDILRAIAVTCVLLSHMLALEGMALPYQAGPKLGRLGVLLFFVHTALVLMSSLERQGTDRRDWVVTFYIRRAFRIYPLAILTVLLAASFAIPEHMAVPAVSPTPITLGILISNLTLTQNLFQAPDVLGVLWSLPVELQMYVLLPLCFLIARRRSWGMLGLIVAGLFLALLVTRDAGTSFTALSVFAYAPCFLGGVLGYHLLRRGVRPVLPALVWPLSIGAAAAMVIALDPLYRHPEASWAPCLMLGISIPLIRETPKGWVTAAAKRVCDVSYGLYLLHEPIMWLCFVLLRFHGLLVQWTLFGVLIVAVPALAYRWIEQPGIRLGRRLTHARPRSFVEVGVP